VCARRRMFRRWAAEYLLGHVKVCGVGASRSRLRQSISCLYLNFTRVTDLKDSERMDCVGACAVVPACPSRMTFFSVLHQLSRIPMNESWICGRESVQINTRNHHRSQKYTIVTAPFVKKVVRSLAPAGVISVVPFGPSRYKKEVTSAPLVVSTSTSPPPVSVRRECAKRCRRHGVAANRRGAPSKQV
jgi:hypothetical protein